MCQVYAVTNLDKRDCEWWYGARCRAPGEGKLHLAVR